jgi:hypothetical protein
VGRLERLAPDLARALGESDLDAEAVVKRACKIAVEESGLDDEVASDRQANSTSGRGPHRSQEMVRHTALSFTKPAPRLRLPSRSMMSSRTRYTKLPTPSTNPTE